MTLGKAFIYLEEARNYRDFLQSFNCGEKVENAFYEMPFDDCDRVAEILDVLLDLVSTIEVVGD